MKDMIYHYFNSSKLYFIALFCVLTVDNQIGAQTILPKKSAKIDENKLAQCKKIVNEIKTMPLTCDTLLFKPLKENEVMEHCVAVYIDEKERIRKFLYMDNTYDGANDRITDTAYYSETGELIYFSSASSNNCEDLRAYYYVNEGSIVDFKREYDCGCCEDDSTEQQTDSLPPMIGSMFAEKFNFNYTLHADTLSKRLKNKFGWRVNFTGTANGCLFYSKADDKPPVMLDFQNTEVDVDIKYDKETHAAYLYEDEIYNNSGVYTTRTADSKATIRYFYKQDKSNSLQIECQGETFSLGDLSGYRFIEGLAVSLDLNDYQYKYPSEIYEGEEYLILYVEREIRLKSDSSDSFIMLQPNSAIVFTIRR